MLSKQGPAVTLFTKKFNKKKILRFTNRQQEAHGGAVGSGTELQVESSRVRFPMVSLEFLIDIIKKILKNEMQETL
jgi:hypothetical protein